MSGARPLWPRNAELFAQGDEGIAALRESAARWGRALATKAAIATSHPFPDRVLPGQGCSCAFGPRCASNRCCADDNQTIGLKDRRTGEIRKLAEWSLMLPLWSVGPAPRVLFYCNDCMKELKAAWGKPIAGITPPKHASEFWLPSLADHVRITAMHQAASETR